MTTAILALNAGSSSIKFALCRRDQALQRQRRCGFHGLSCAALIQELARIGGADAAYAGLISRPASSSTVRVMRTNKKTLVASALVRELARSSDVTPNGA